MYLLAMIKLHMCTICIEHVCYPVVHVLYVEKEDKSSKERVKAKQGH